MGRPKAKRPQRVVASHLERGLGAAYLLESHEHRGAVEQPLDQRPAGAGGAEGLGGGALEGDARVRARGVDGGDGRARHAARAQLREVERHGGGRSLRRFRGDDGEVGHVAVGNRQLGAAEAAVASQRGEVARRGEPAGPPRARSSRWPRPGPGAGATASAAPGSRRGAAPRWPGRPTTRRAWGRGCGRAPRPARRARDSRSLRPRGSPESRYPSTRAHPSRARAHDRRARPTRGCAARGRARRDPRGTCGPGRGGPAAPPRRRNSPGPPQPMCRRKKSSVR